MSQDPTTDDLELDIDELQTKLARVREEVGRRLVGQQRVLDDLLACVLADGNALLESNPGLAKTLTVRTLANVTDLDFSRVQNTPDLMPSDITGTEIIREGEGGSRDFVFEQGPIFANVVLADEINRATPKTQAALLEAMEEGQVTAAGETHALPDPFFVMATQNPIEQEGTYRLPEAQMDRFLLKILVDYPSLDEELAVVDRYTGRVDEAIPVEQVLSREELLDAQTLTREVPIADDIRERAVELVRETREADHIEYGASPRASMALVVTAKARALIEGRAYVSEDDIERMAKPVLRHRVVVDFRAERDGMTPDDAVDELL
ncbi:AAA family ATPase [Haloglomus salinum]|jgi:MoxR-like ATPase|uniref:AAA family ATPase n=1 Tax=Haloglomus salinum TaxID=2962673 RepID=UPI0020C9A618|nr:MoxR family ATPase [Haloglomus salinum]